MALQMGLPALLGALALASADAAPTLLFVTDVSSTNDILTAARSYHPYQKVPTKTFATVALALSSALPGDGLLIMADGMLPADPGAPAANANATVVVTDTEWAAIKAKKLKVYLEFPRSAPPEDSSSLKAGDGVGSAVAPLQMAQTLWERAAVSDPAGLGDELPFLALIHPHKKVDYVKLPPAWLSKKTSIVIAKARNFITERAMISIEK